MELIGENILKLVLFLIFMLVIITAVILVVRSGITP